MLLSKVYEKYSQLFHLFKFILEHETLLAHNTLEHNAVCICIVSHNWDPTKPTAL